MECNEQYLDLPKPAEQIMSLMLRMKKMQFWEITPELSPAEAMILSYLCPSGKDKKPAIKPVQLSTLTQDLRLLPASVSRTMKSMEEQGLICRYTDPKSRRNIIVEATDQGLELAILCQKRIRGYWDEVFKQIPQEDWDSLIRILTEFTDSMETVLKEYKKEEETEKSINKTRRN